MLTRKPTDLGNGPLEDDFGIYDGGRLIGRVVKVANLTTDPWIWSITARLPQMPADRGSAATREEALVTFKAAWQHK